MLALVLVLVCIVKPTRSQTDVPLHYRIVEELTPGTDIADLMVDAGFKRRYTADILAQLEFRLLSEPPPVPVRVNSKTGILSSSGRVDREQLRSCRNRNSCQLTLDVTVRPPRYFQIIKIIIDIRDINDNAPRFRNSSAIIGVRESAVPGTTFALPVAVDSDSPDLGVRAYELLREDGTPLGYEPETVTLSIVTRRDGSLDPRLVVRRLLDREKQDEYRRRLVAYDGGRPPRSASIDLLIQILDSNDNRPVFDIPHGLGYEVNVTENVAVGTVLLRVHASDADEGLNGEIVYSFSSNTLTTYGELFNIDNVTGEITVAGTLNREIHPVYQLTVVQLTVVAKDRGPDAMPTDAAVVIRIIDVNDHAPTIVVNTLSSRGGGSGSGSAVAEVPENLPEGTFVAHVTVADADSGEFGRVDCNLTDNAFTLLRRPGSTEFQLVTSVSLDRERQDHYNLLVTCWDGGRPALTSTTLVPVRVLDVNDNSPQFAATTYTARLTENNDPGVNVVRVVAADADDGLNAELHYVLAASVPGGAFDVDRADGSVRALASVNRERYSSFSFAIYAVDHGTPSLTGSALVVVVVSDVNDEFPVFARDIYEFTVDENRPEGTDVGSVFAVDGDVASSNGAVSYSIVNSGHGDLLPFSVESTTGNIRTTMPLDREQRTDYNLQIAAVDHGEPALTATVDVIIRVTDENDNSPVLEFLSSTSPSLSISAGASLLDVDTIIISSAVPRGFVICRAVAHDADIGENAHVEFQLVSQPEVDDVSHLFDVNADTGEITVASEFSGRSRVSDGESREYLLTVRGTDGGLPSRSVDAVLRVVVNGSLPYTRIGDALLTTNSIVAGNHVTLVVVIAGCSALMTVALVVAIAIVRMHSRKSRRRLRQYDIQRSLTSDDMMKSTVTSFETVPLSSTYCSNDALHPTSLPLQSASCSKLANGTVHVADNTFPTLSSKKTSSQHRVTTGEQEHDSQHSGDGSNADSGRGHSCTEDEDRGLRGQRAFRLVPPPPPRLSPYNTMPQVLPAHSDAARHTLKTFSANPDCEYLHKYFRSATSSPPDDVRSNCTPQSPEQSGSSVIWSSNCNGLIV